MVSEQESRFPRAVAALKAEFISAHPYEKVAVIAAPFLLFASAWVQVLLPADSDKGWLLHAAHEWLGGRALYTDIFEVNPPLILWIYALPEWVSLHSGLTDYQALGLMGLLGSALSAAVSARVMRWHPGFAGSLLRRVEFALLLGLVFVFYTMQMYFFDRDHMFLVLAFPYILRFMPSLAEAKMPVRLRVLVGCMAAVGFCVKPHTIIVFAALQLFFLLRRRSLAAVLNIENAVIALAALLYLLATFRFHPDYLTTVLPMALATYSAFGNFGAGYAFLPPLFICAFLIFSDFRPWHVTPFHKDVYYFMWLCLAMLVYAQMQNGWGYTFNPLSCTVMFCTGWMLWEYDWLRRESRMRRLPIRGIFFGLRGCIIVFLVQGAWMGTYLNAMNMAIAAPKAACRGPMCELSRPYMKYIEEHHIHSFGTLSLDFSMWVALLRLPDVRWETRFNHLWMLPKLVQPGQPHGSDQQWIITKVGQYLAQDLDGRRPEIMLVDSSPGFMGYIRRFDYAGFFTVVPEFKQAWAHYRYTTTVDMCETASMFIPLECKYDIYTRAP